MSLVCAAESEGSSSDSHSRSRKSTSSASSSGDLKLDGYSLATSKRLAARLRSETTFGPKTSDAGVDAWTFSLRAGRAKGSRRLLEEGQRTPTSGRMSRAPSMLADRIMSFSRTSTELRGPWLHGTSNPSGTVLFAESFARRLWERPIADRARFYWPTPTAKANHWAPSMRKWPAYRRLQDAIPQPNSELFEWMMGLPAGWISSDSPARAPFRRWRRSHLSLFWTP